MGRDCTRAGRGSGGARGVGCCLGEHKVAAGGIPSGVGGRSSDARGLGAGPYMCTSGVFVCKPSVDPKLHTEVNLLF